MFVMSVFLPTIQLKALSIRVHVSIGFEQPFSLCAWQLPTNYPPSNLLHLGLWSLACATCTHMRLLPAILKINSLRKFRLALINEHYRYFSRWWIFHLVLLSDLIVVLLTAWYDYQVLFLIFCSNEFNWCFILFYFFFSSYYLSVCQLSSSVTTSHTEVRTWYESFLVT